MNILKSKIGIIQGRLTQTQANLLQCFPKDWKKEFAICSDIGLNYIELLIEETHNPKNPIWSQSGRLELKKAANKVGISFYSICLDSAISTCISNFSEEYFEDLLTAASDLQAKIIVIPLMGHSLLTVDSIASISVALKRFAKKATKHKVRLAIESIAEPNLILNLIKISSGISIVFDTGNRINLSENICSEITALSKFIIHIHIRTRILNHIMSSSEQGLFLLQIYLNFYKKIII